MAKKPLPCPTLLRLLLTYEPETGKLFWKKRKSWMAPRGGVRAAGKAVAIWNGRNAGNMAFTATTNGGYRVGWLFGVKSYAHRVIWALIHGEWPDVIDHIDGDRGNNLISNLRSVTKAENARNARVGSNNKTGVMGVGRSKAGWYAKICAGGVAIHIGTFETFGDAVDARKNAEVKYGYHENHGRRV